MMHPMHFPHLPHWVLWLWGLLMVDPMVPDSRPVTAHFDPRAPWLAHMIMEITFWLGPTAIVASVFMAMWAGWIPSPITKNQEILVRIESKLDDAYRRMTEDVRANRNADESGTRLLLIICRNTARNVQQELQCNDYWKR